MSLIHPVLKKQEILSLKISVWWHHRKPDSDSWLQADLTYIMVHSTDTTKSKKTNSLMLTTNLKVHKQYNMLATTPVHSRRDYKMKAYKMDLRSDVCVETGKGRCLENCWE